MTNKYGPFPSGPGANLGINDYADYLGPMLRGDGVNTTSYGDATLQTYANNSGLQVLVRPGSAMIRGAMYQSDADNTLTIAPNASGSTRIDRVVLTHNRSSNLISLTVITGTPGAGAPSLTQAVGGVWQIPLAQVTVAAGNTSGITPGNVADDRQYLPLQIAVCDTRYATPPTDGSKGRIFYDKNPAVLDIIVTNGTSWAAISDRDTGWVNLSFASQGWATAGFGPQVRRVGNTVEFRVDATASGFGSPPHTNAVLLAAPLPAAYRPASFRSFPAWAALPVGEFTQAVIDADGTVSIPGASPGYRYLVNAVYLVG